MRDQGDAESTRVLCEESLALFQECANPVGIALARTNLGLAALERGDSVRACSLLEEALALGPSMEALDGLALLALEQGDAPRAERWVRERLERHSSADCVAGVVNALDGMAGVAALQGRAGRAVYLYGAATGLREAHGIAVRAIHRRLRGL